MGYITSNYFNNEINDIESKVTYIDSVTDKNVKPKSSSSESVTAKEVKPASHAKPDVTLHNNDLNNQPITSDDSELDITPNENQNSPSIITEPKKNAPMKGKVIEIKNNDNSTKKVTLIDKKLSDKEKQDILKRAQEIDNNNSTEKLKSDEIDIKTLTNQKIKSASTLYIAHDLSMGNVPVLDQGAHGSCVTFAATAAIDAKMNAGDYISQQCLLELGNHINKVKDCEKDEDFSNDGDDDEYGCSGWEGLMTASSTLSRINKYGVVSKTSCPESYILSENHPFKKNSLNYQQYRNLSNNLWTNAFTYKKLTDGNVNQVKNAINNNHRVVIGIHLHADYIGGLPINGKPYGLWSLPYNANKFAYEMMYEDKYGGGHALVITGYDDQRQLFKVRNSWSDKVGDSGEFYISYDYYKLLNDDALEVI